MTNVLKEQLNAASRQAAAGSAAVEEITAQRAAMLKKVLVVSPHFPPTSTADLHRVRLLLPYFRRNGWQAEVLAVDPAQVQAPVDEWLLGGLPADVPVHRVPALGLAWRRIPGFGTLPWRAWRGLRSAGNRLLAQKRFDVIYFSTTAWPLHLLGPSWRRKFGVPFVMDYQDPWVNDYYRKHPEAPPPGGKLKYTVSAWLSRRQEPHVLGACAGITSVSPEYTRQLRNRYKFLREDLPTAILPFPADDADLQRVHRDGPFKQPLFDPGDGNTHWVSVGRGGEDLHFALRALLQATMDFGRRNPEMLKRLRIHFIGTSYAAAGQGKKSLEPLAREFGLSEQVIEHPDRVPYSSALRCLLDAHALLLLGSNDPGYTASKAYPNLLARRPALAIFHQQSSVVSLIKTVGGAVIVPFGSEEKIGQVAARIGEQWFAQGQYGRVVPLDAAAFEPYSAASQVRVVTELFGEVLARSGGRISG